VVSSGDILNAKILIVDDKPDNVLLLEGMLRIAGYKCVESTTDPTQVCALYRQNRYNLILLDLQMPVMDGFEVMQGLTEIEGDGYLPVLVLTAQPSQKLRALQAGAKDFVSKPFEMAELRARVSNILEVRLLHLKTIDYSRQLEETVRQLEACSEVIRLKDLEEQKKREQEFALAQQTQESLLPPFIPEFENFHVHAFNQPTRYVGGDFYDFLQLPSAEWTGVLADVSGKGMSAALLSSMVLGSLSSELRSGAQPHEALNRINRLLCEKSLPFQFVTLFFFLLSPEGDGKFISAGHNPTCLFRAATGKIEWLLSEQFFLGMFDFVTYESRPIHMNRGDILIVYSDGLTEAESRQGEMFGEERLVQVIRSESPAGGCVLKQKLLQSIAEFTEGMPQTDDITLVIVEKYQ
jgi:serine phosphatase RsbU (regulator of sigma subunit)